MGAALLTQSGRIIRGASIDNAAYGAFGFSFTARFRASWMETKIVEATVCAERVAIVKAVVSSKLLRFSTLDVGRSDGVIG